MLGLWLGEAVCRPALQAHSPNRSFSRATSFSQRLLCAGLVRVLGLSRRSSDPVPAQGKETDIIATQKDLEWRKEAQEKEPNFICVVIMALLFNVFQHLFGEFLLYSEDAGGKSQIEFPFPLSMEGSSHPRSE